MDAEVDSVVCASPTMMRTSRQEIDWLRYGVVYKDIYFKYCSNMSLQHCVARRNYTLDGRNVLAQYND